jgi:hypothetical protein
MSQGDSSDYEKLKKLAAGPLGEQQSKFPLLFAKPVFFGERPSKEKAALVRNGTVTLVDFGLGPILITCAHVIQTYRNFMATHENVVFQIGNLELDPIPHLIEENFDLDLATLRLSPEQIKAIELRGEIGSHIFQPVKWPSPRIGVGQGVLFGGYPEAFREIHSYNELDFPSWSSGGSLVTTAYDDRFSCQFERDRWVSSFGAENDMELRALSGLSGGPAFVHRGLYFDFVGIIYEYQPELDVLFLRPSQFIRNDGTLG